MTPLDYVGGDDDDVGIISFIPMRLVTLTVGGEDEVYDCITCTRTSAICAATVVCQTVPMLVCLHLLSHVLSDACNASDASPPWCKYLRAMWVPCHTKRDIIQ